MENTKQKLLVIFPFSTIIFFYPLAIVSLICGFLKYFLYPTLPEFLFVSIFAINSLVVTINFQTTKAIAFFFTFLAAILGINFFLGVFQFIESSAEFYFAIAIVLCFMIFVSLLNNLINYYYQIFQNQSECGFIRRNGFSDLIELEITNLNLYIDIDNLLKYLLCSSATLHFVITTKKQRYCVSIQDVPFVWYIKKRIPMFNKNWIVKHGMPLREEFNLVKIEN